MARHPDLVSGRVAATSRDHGNNGEASFKWLKRCENEGFKGLKHGYSVPHLSPTMTSPSSRRRAGEL